MRLDDHEVQPNYGGRFRTHPAWSLGPSRTTAWRDLTLWLLVDGHGIVHAPEGRMPIGPGSCLLLRGGLAYTVEPAVRLTHWFAHFDLVDEHGQVRDHQGLQLPPTMRVLGDVPRAEALWERLAAALPNDGRRARHWLTALVQEIATQESLAGAARDLITSGIEEFARRMREDPADAHRIGVWATRLGIGRDQVRRRFSASHGQAPREYLTAQRMRLAEHLLSDSSDSIGEIARIAGYASPYFFSRHFRRHAGCSPSAYRRIRR